MPRKSEGPKPLMRRNPDTNKMEQATNEDGVPIYRVRIWDSVVKAQHEEKVAGRVAALTRWQELLGAKVARPNQRLSQEQVSVLEAAKRFIEEYKTKLNGEPRPRATVKKVSTMIFGYVTPKLGHVMMDYVDLPDLSDIVENMELLDGSPASPGSKSTLAGAIRSMWKWARKRRLVKTNVALELETGFGAPARRRIVIPSLPMVERQAETMESYQAGLGDIVRTLAYTGMRWEEAVAVPLDLVNLTEQTLVVAFTASEGGGKREVRGDTKTLAGQRTIIIPDIAMPAIRRLVERAEDGQVRWPDRFSRLINGVRGGFYPYVSWRRYLEKAREETGEAFYTPHELRHVCASFLIGTKGWTDVQIANQMGHAKVQTTKNIYAHLFAMDRAALLAALNDRIATLHVVDGAGEGDDGDAGTPALRVV